MTYLPVDAHGHIRLEELEAAIRPETILVSIMYVNNEIGAVEPIEAISKIIKKEESVHPVSCGCHSGLRKVCHPSKAPGD